MQKFACAWSSSDEKVVDGEGDAQRRDRDRHRRRERDGPVHHRRHLRRGQRRRPAAWARRGEAGAGGPRGRSTSRSRSRSRSRPSTIRGRSSSAARRSSAARTRRSPAATRAASYGRSAAGETSCSVEVGDAKATVAARVKDSRTDATLSRGGESRRGVEGPHGGAGAEVPYKEEAARRRRRPSGRGREGAAAGGEVGRGSAAPHPALPR